MTCEIFFAVSGLCLLFPSPLFFAPGAIGLLCNASNLLATIACEVLHFLKRLRQLLPMQSFDGFVAILPLTCGASAGDTCLTLVTEHAGWA